MPNEIANNMADTIHFLEEDNASMMKSLTNLQLAYNEQMLELREAKMLLKAAIKVINENCDGFCEYCKYYYKFNLSSCELGIDVCENNNQWEWKYEAKALKLIGNE